MPPSAIAVAILSMPDPPPLGGLAVLDAQLTSRMTVGINCCRVRLARATTPVQRP